MKDKGKIVAGVQEAQVLHWQGRVVSADALRRSLNGHRELVLLPGTVITPLAADELRGLGIRISRQEKAVEITGGNDAWGYAQEQPNPLITSVIQALGREGLHLKPLQPTECKEPSTWARAVADWVARAECQGGVVFCSDPGLVRCVANNVNGLRAAPVINVFLAGRAPKNRGANLISLELPGQTFVV